MAPNQTCASPMVMYGIDASGNILCRHHLSKTIFLSSATYNGNLGGLSGADNNCQTLANSVGLAGEYKAWLSDASSSPSIRFEKSNFPYVLPDNTKVADNWDDLTDGSLYQGVVIDEHGLKPFESSSVYVWTNSANNGTQWDTAHCNNWTTSASTSEGFVGEAKVDIISTYWTKWGNVKCDTKRHLYCVQQ